MFLDHKAKVPGTNIWPAPHGGKTKKKRKKNPLVLEAGMAKKLMGHTVLT